MSKVLYIGLHFRACVLEIARGQRAIEEVAEIRAPFLMAIGTRKEQERVIVGVQAGLPRSGSEALNDRVESVIQELFAAGKIIKYESDSVERAQMPDSGSPIWRALE